MGIIAARDWPMIINLLGYNEHNKVMDRPICELTNKLPTTNQRHFDNTQPLAPTNDCDSTCLFLITCIFVRNITSQSLAFIMLVSSFY